jgi:hypothetical protein
MVVERDLMADLDLLDEFAPNAKQEYWYKRLSAALELHLKPKIAPSAAIFDINPLAYQEGYRN